MKNLIKSKVFIFTFLLTYFLFFVITISILDLKSAGGGVENFDYGFPFIYYHSHCFGGYYLWFGIVGNILFAAVFSIVFGLVSSHFWLKFLLPFWRKISSPKFRSKWYI
jgi:hypothetical protein